MKLFQFNIVEREIATWSTESSAGPKIEDFLYTTYQTDIQKCFEKTLDFKRDMKSNSGSFDVSLSQLKFDINQILANNEFIGSKYEEDHAEINFILYDKTVKNRKNTELYRTRVRQYSDFFAKKITEEEIEDIHPFESEKENSGAKSFLVQFREKQLGDDKFSVLEFNRTTQSSTMVTAFTFQLPVIYESISMENPSLAMVSIQFLTLKDDCWVPSRVSNRKRESLRFFLREALDESNFRRNAFAQGDIWIQNHFSTGSIESNEKYTVQLRRMKILKKTQFVQEGHFIFPMGKTSNQKSGLCAHEFALVLKIADGRKFTEPKFHFYV